MVHDVKLNVKPLITVENFMIIKCFLPWLQMSVFIRDITVVVISYQSHVHNVH
jgi:hypothetical protein